MLVYILDFSRIQPLHPSLPASYPPLPPNLVSRWNKKQSNKGVEKKDSNIHNNQTAFADCLGRPYNIKLAGRATAKNLKNLALAISQLCLIHV